MSSVLYRDMLLWFTGSLIHVLLCLVQLFIYLSQSFLDGTRTHYKAELEAVDFMGNFEGAREKINKWVEEQTAEKIRGLLPAGSIDPLTRLVLVNAIYFKVRKAKC